MTEKMTWKTMTNGINYLYIIQNASHTRRSLYKRFRAKPTYKQIQVETKASCSDQCSTVASTTLLSRRHAFMRSRDRPLPLTDNAALFHPTPLSLFHPAPLFVSSRPCLCLATFLSLSRPAIRLPFSRHVSMADSLLSVEA
jgi:hypothetical protein